MNESEESSIPKLSLLSRSSMWEWELPEGSKTPPIIAPLSIPFKWEEVPGKPKPTDIDDIPSGLSASRSLHLPPRLLVHDHGSPSTKLFAVSSLRSRSYSSRAELVSIPQQWRNTLDSPTSILNSPPSSTSSRGSSTCSDEVVGLQKLNKQNVHKMRRLLEHCTPSFRWPKVKEEYGLPSFSDDDNKSHYGDDSQGMSSTYSSIAPAPARKIWVLRKMKRSSRVFGTILKRMRSRKEDCSK